jgi:hypothetical protein
MQHIRKIEPESRATHMLCPGCNLKRTLAEFMRAGLVYAYCAVCRARQPKLRKPMKVN